jgi:hypothetical protein
MLWIQIAARCPIRHIGQFWAVERTHQEAKTIAQANRFVDEAFRLIPRLEEDPRFAQSFAAHKKEIYAGMHVFAGRRLIDNNQPRQALSHFYQAWKLYPKAPLNMWYKVLQAAGGAVGLGKLFLAYRQLRRKISHQDKRLAVSEHGLEWETV